MVGFYVFDSYSVAHTLLPRTYGSGAAIDGVSGEGVIADGAALEACFSAQEPENLPNPPTSARYRVVPLPIYSKTPIST